MRHSRSDWTQQLKIHCTQVIYECNNAFTDICALMFMWPLGERSQRPRLSRWQLILVVPSRIFWSTVLSSMFGIYVLEFTNEKTRGTIYLIKSLNSEQLLIHILYLYLNEICRKIFNTRNLKLQFSCVGDLNKWRMIQFKNSLSEAWKKNALWRWFCPGLSGNSVLTGRSWCD